MSRPPKAPRGASPRNHRFGCAASFGYFFGLYEVFVDPFGKGRVMVIIFFVGPLLTAGIALIRAEPDQEDEQVTL